MYLDGFVFNLLYLVAYIYLVAFQLLPLSSCLDLSSCLYHAATPIWFHHFCEGHISHLTYHSLIPSLAKKNAQDRLLPLTVYLHQCRGTIQNSHMLIMALFIWRPVTCEVRILVRGRYTFHSTPVAGGRSRLGERTPSNWWFIANSLLLLIRSGRQRKMGRNL